MLEVGAQLGPYVIVRRLGAASKAKKLGQELLNRFPDHGETMEALGELCMDSKDFKKAQEYFEKAIQANPLDRSLRKELARAKQNYGLSLTLAGKLDKAREQYEHAPVHRVVCNYIAGMTDGFFRRTYRQLLGP